MTGRETRQVPASLIFPVIDITLVRGHVYQK